MGRRAVMDNPVIHLDGYSLTDLKALFRCSVNDIDFYHVLGREIASQDPSYIFDRVKDCKGARRRGAVFGISYIPRERTSEAVPILNGLINNSEDSFTIAEAIDTARAIKAKQLWKKIRLFSNHESPFVRAAALRFSVFSVPADAISILKDSILDADQIVREAIIDLLEEIATQRAVTVLQMIASIDANENIRNEAMNAIRNIK